MSFLNKVVAANRFDPRRYRPFHVGDHALGFATHEFARELIRFPQVFSVSEQALALVPSLDTAKLRTGAIRPVMQALREQGLIHGWRDEDYEVKRCFGDQPSLQMERAAVPFLGATGYGVHLNGYVRRGKNIFMWVGKRSLDKPTSPGKLDQIVAGGQAAGMGLMENLIKECAEEAGIPEELAKQAVAVGSISYCRETFEGLRPDVIFNFDLELPEDFKPTNQDGEVAEFRLLPIEEVSRLVDDTDQFKYNCALVVIDFLIRHKLLSCSHPDYQRIMAGLRGRGNGLNFLLGQEQAHTQSNQEGCA